MGGWDKTSGSFNIENRVEEINELFQDAYEGTSYTTTYKFVIIAALLKNILRANHECEIIFEQLTEDVIRPYWNQIIYYGLLQTNKSTKTTVENVLNQYVALNPQLSKKNYKEIGSLIPENIKKQVLKEVTKYAVGAVYKDFSGQLFAFDKKYGTITLNFDALAYISKNERELLELNRTYWLKYLAKFNPSESLELLEEKIILSEYR